MAASLIGPTVQASVADTTVTWNWLGHMSDRGHMWDWWNDSESATSSPRVEGADEVVVVATDFDFAPSEVTVSAGEPVNLRLVNEGRLPHDLVIPELDLRVSAGAGGEGVAGLDPEPGVYEFWCSYPGHESQGMIGTLTVESAS